MTYDEQITKAFILAGGKGTRLSEYTHLTPKPLVEISDFPILIHVMRNFYRVGVRDFYILCGYKTAMFKDFFDRYMSSGGDVVYTRYGKRSLNDDDQIEDWRVHIIETGLESTTGQRIYKAFPHISDDDAFFLTYGDSVSDVDVRKVEKLHNEGEDIVTLTAVSKTERWGALTVDATEHKVTRFAEKNDAEDHLINGGFMVCSRDIITYLSEESGDFSHDVLTKLANDNALGYYRHTGFWHAMDTQRDVESLREIYKKNPDLP